jgi:hypothetical protein
LAGSLPTGVKITPLGVVVKGVVILNNTQTILGEYYVLLYVTGMGILWDPEIFHGGLKAQPPVTALVHMPYRLRPLVAHWVMCPHAKLTQWVRAKVGD